MINPSTGLLIGLKADVVTGLLAQSGYTPSAQVHGGCSWVQRTTAALNGVDAVCYSVAGTQGNRSATAYLFSDVNGAPGVQLDASTAITNFGISILQFTGFTYSCIAGSRYWILIKNTAVAPDTDKFAIGIEGSFNSMLTGGTAKWGNALATTANNGTSYTVTASGFHVLLTFAGPTYYGTTIFNQTSSTFKVYGTREEGFGFTTPPNASINVCGIGMSVTAVGPPTGTLSAIVKYGVTTQTSIAIPIANVVSGFQKFYFAAAFSIPPNTAVTVTIKDSAADDASHYFQVIYYDIPNYATHRSIIPWSMYYVSSTDGTTYTTTNTRAVLGGIIIANNGEFVTPGSPTAGQVLREADGGPSAKWEWGTIGPGTAVAEAHSDDEVVDTADDPGNFKVSGLANDKILIGTEWGIGGVGELVASKPLVPGSACLEIQNCQQGIA